MDDTSKRCGLQMLLSETKPHGRTTVRDVQRPPQSRQGPCGRSYIGGDEDEADQPPPGPTARGHRPVR
eukprot:12407911-Heterocapsa_arctica.AAC.1